MENNSNESKRRRIIPGLINTSSGVVKVDRVNSVSSMLDRALNIIDDQLIKLSLKSRAAILDEKEAKVIQGYVRSLVELSKEEREREKTQREIGNLDELSTEQLLELAKEQLTDLKTKVGK